MPRRSALLRLALCAALCAPAWAPPAAAAAAGGGRTDAPLQARPGEFLVEYASGVAPSARTRGHAAAGARLLARGRGAVGSRWDRVKVDPSTSLAEARAAYAGADGVLGVQPNYVYRPAAMPDDTYFIQQWGLNNFGQTLGALDADIDAPEAWEVTTGDSDVVVAVIDTGIDYMHPDLAANCWVNAAEQDGAPGVDDDGNGYVDDVHGWDWAQGDAIPLPGAGENHGTMVAGVIAAVGDNARGVAGVSWRSKVMPLRFMDSSGGDTFAAIEAIDYAARMGADVINASWGAHLADASSGTADEALRRAVERSGILFVAAAGNDGGDNDDLASDAFVPASYDSQNVIAVTASDDFDDLWRDTLGGGRTGVASVDLAAPGVGIRSTAAGDSYTSLTGTSLSAPHVSGAAALALSVNPGLSVAQLKRVLCSAVDELDSLSGAVSTQGRLNAASVVELAPVPPAASIGRISGTDRYDAAARIAMDSHPGLTGVDSVVLASGDDRAAADPLAASGLVWALDGAPLLLTSATKLPTPTAQAFSAIGVGGTGALRVLVVGGPVSVPDERLADIAARVPGRAIEFVRVAGSDRYATAEKVVERMRAERPFQMPRIALVANGERPSAFFDALALSPIAARIGAPVLLTRESGVPAATQRALDRVDPLTTIVAGGPASVSSSVVSALGAERWWGADRYACAAAVAHDATARGWLRAEEAVVAAALPDALGGGAAVGTRGGVLLLTSRDRLEPATRTWLWKRSGVVDRVRVVGGTASVGTRAFREIAPAVQ